MGGPAVKYDARDLHAMYTIPPLLRSQSNQVLATRSADTSTATQESVSPEFDSLMRGLLKADGENNVNEEELFASLIVERISSLKGQSAADSFKTLLEKHKGQSMGTGGYCFVENAARGALKEYQASGALTPEEANSIHAQAFEAAQLDSNKTALFDSIGGPNDPTKAVASMETALLAAQSLLKKFDSGEITVPSHPVDGEYPALGTEPLKSLGFGVGGGDPGIGAKEAGEYKPKGFRLDGAEGMLWKPFSHTTGKLIMLLPPSYTKQVASLTLRDAEGHKIDSGRYFSVGLGPNGREKWVFSKPGNRYPEDITLHVKFKDGNTKRIHIAKPGRRYD